MRAGRGIINSMKETQIVLEKRIKAYFAYSCQRPKILGIERYLEGYRVFTKKYPKGMYIPEAAMVVRGI
jgi:hypothetical protein